MIISHRHKFMFFPIPKTGTHSIREALRPHMGKYDWEQCVLFEDKRFPIKELAVLPHGHFSVRQVKKYFPKGTWDQYYKFCIVRNPFDRFVSFCNFYFGEKMKENPEETMLNIFKNPDKLLHHHFLLKPQYQFICDKELKSEMDFIGKFENLESDFEKIGEMLSIKTGRLSPKNISKGNKKILNHEIRSYICEYYSIDFHLFNYSKYIYQSWIKNQSKKTG